MSGFTWKKLTAGGDHTCGIDTADEAWCWGSDDNGELGDNGSADQGTPVQVDDIAMGTVSTISAGKDFTCAVDKTVLMNAWCWGNGDVGQLGNGSQFALPTPDQVDGFFHWTVVAAGESHACGIDNSSHVRCWGAGDLGQIGDGAQVMRLTPSLAAGSDTYSGIAAGGDFACGISIGASGTASCWGWNRKSTLANGFLLVQSAAIGVLGNHLFTQVATGEDHTCALDTGGLAWCWGDNAFDELGTGDEVAHSIPVAVTGAHVYSQISAMYVNTCAREAGAGDQNTWCWGDNSAGAIGDGTFFNAPNPVQPAGLVKQFSQISAGLGHTCAVQSAGATYCWGDNTSGQLGDGTTTTQPQPNAVPSFSANAIAAGFFFTCAIEAVAHHAWCWGRNIEGQLGNGVFGPEQHSPVQVSGTHAFSVIAAGAFYACGLEEGTGNAYCWGSNIKGQLGDGTQTAKTFRP